MRTPNDPDAEIELRRKVVHMAAGGGALVLGLLPFWAAVAFGVTLVVLNLVVLPLTGWDRSLRRAGEPVLSGFTLYPVSVLLLIVLFEPPVAAAAWGILAAGDGVAAMAGRSLGGGRLPWNPRKTLSGTVAFVAFSLPVAAFLLAWTGTWHASLHAPGDAAVPSGAVIVAMAAAGAIAGALAESVPLPLDDNLPVALASALAMVCARALA